MKKFPAYVVYLILAGAYSFFLWTIITTHLVYQSQVVGMNPLQLVLAGTVLEITVLLCEVPTGVVADVVSRRLSIILGYTVMGIGFIVTASIPRFEIVLIGQVLWGLGHTFTSGATHAWLSDEIGEMGANRAIFRGSQVEMICALPGIPASVALASIALHLPILIGGICVVGLAVFLLLFMPETGFKREMNSPLTPQSPRPRPTGISCGHKRGEGEENQHSWRAMIVTFRAGFAIVRGRPALWTILAVGVVYGMFSEGFDRLWQRHILDHFTLPALGSLDLVAWFGVMLGGGMLLMLGVTEAVRRRVDTHDYTAVARTLLVFNALIVGGVLAYALAESFWLALAAFWLVYPLRLAQEPLYITWVNQRLDSQTRATVLSMSSQMDAVGQIAGGPVVGAIGTAWSVRAALVAASVILSPALALYARAARHTSKDTAVYSSD